MTELTTPMTGKMINQLSIMDKSKLRDHATQVIQSKGYNPFRVADQMQGPGNCGFITPDPDAFTFAGLASKNPVVTVTLSEQMMPLEMVYTQIAQQAFDEQPQAAVTQTAIQSQLEKQPVTFLVEVDDQLPVNTRNTDVLMFAQYMRGLTSNYKCSVVVHAKNYETVPTELARNLHNLSVPKK